MQQRKILFFSFHIDERQAKKKLFIRSEQNEVNFDAFLHRRRLPLEENYLSSSSLLKLFYIYIYLFFCIIIKSFLLKSLQFIMIIVIRFIAESLDFIDRRRYLLMCYWLFICEWGISMDLVKFFSNEEFFCFIYWVVIVKMLLVI